MRGRWGIALSAAAGVALPLGFAPFHAHWATPLLLAGLILLIADQKPGVAAWRGFWFGFGAFAAGTYWLFISIHTIGGAPPALAAVLMLLLFCLMASYVAGFAALLAAGRGTGPLLRFLGAAPALWVLTEWLRGWLFTGFPWLTLGYSLIDSPLRALGPVSGVYGLSFAAALLAGVMVVLVRGTGRQRLAAGAVATVLIGLSLLAGRVAWVSPAAGELRVGLIQGSVPQERKWRIEERAATLALYRDLTSALVDLDVVVWPEAALPALAREVEPFLAAQSAAARVGGYQLLLGILVDDEVTGAVTNSLLALGSRSGRYDKRHLVPFGEYFPVPGFVREFLRFMNLPYQDIASGSAEQPPLPAGPVLAAPSICYEDAFGAEQRSFLPEAQLLVNVSNDGWFGDSIAPHQHLQIARMRSLEAGRDMLRATNTGVTAIISHDGQVRATLPQFYSGALTGVATPMQGATPYVRWGDLPVLALCAALCAAAWFAARARRTAVA